MNILLSGALGRTQMVIGYYPGALCKAIPHSLMYTNGRIIYHSLAQTILPIQPLASIITPCRLALLQANPPIWAAKLTRENYDLFTEGKIPCDKSLILNNFLRPCWSCPASFMWNTAQRQEMYDAIQSCYKILIFIKVSCLLVLSLGSQP